MSLVERDSVLGRIRALLVNSGAGRGGALLIEGTPGAGKTEVLHAAGQMAAATGAWSIFAAASRAERRLPLAVVDQLLQSARLPDDSAERMLRLLDASLRSRPDTDRAAVAEEASPEVLRELSAMVLRVAAQRPVLIGIDDLQHCDDASLECLLFLIRRIRVGRVVVVAAAGSSLCRPDPGWRAELLAQPHCQHVTVGPLSSDGVAAVLAAELGDGVDGQFVTAAYGISRGVPVLVRALAEDCAAGSADRGSITVGERFKQAFLTCLHRDDPASLSLARAIAVLGPSAEVPTLSEFSNVSPDSVGAWIGALETTGLLVDGRFTHPAAGAAVLTTLSDEARRAAHARAAAVLHDAGYPPHVVAGHLIRARETRSWSAPVLHRAGETALADGDVDFALSCLRLAERNYLDPQLRAQVKSMLTCLEWRVNPQAAARHIPDIADAINAGHLNGRRALASAGCLLWFGRVSEAAAVIDKLNFGDGENPSCTRPDWPGPLMQLLERIPEPPGPAARVRPASPAVDPETSADQILQLTRLDDESFPALVAAITALVYADRIADATRWCDDLVAESARHDAPTWHAVLAAIRATISLRHGAVDAAAEQAAQALALIRDSDWGSAIGVPLACAVAAATERRRFDEAAGLLSRPVPDSMFLTPAGMQYLQARGRYRLATGHAAAALDDFQAYGRLIDTWQLTQPGIVPAGIEVARAYLALGRRDEARDSLERELAAMSERHRHNRGIALRLLAATEVPAHAVPLLQESSTILRAQGDHAELAYALVELSRAHRGLGAHRDADSCLREAEAVAMLYCGEDFDRNLVEPASGVPATIVGPSPARSEALDSLTNAERRVTDLVARGRTNRQIASALYVTISTVEQHLTRIYRKLGVNSRRELLRHLAAGHGYEEERRSA